MKRSRLRLLPPLALLAGVIALAPTGATAGPIPPAKVKIVGNQNPHFVVEQPAVATGQDLKVVNKTNPRAIGPHTFSLVVPGDIPRTHHQIRTCFHGQHICRRVALAWHEFDFATGQPGVNPVDPGADGWDQMGRLDPHRKGDSFFFDQEGEAQTETVSATPGTTIHFMCIVHPFMHGKITVAP